ncbi:MAG: Lytic transglycosylase catalytic [Gemmatimonadetes bacterium]|nr:Lytic transglycosylase catalytic [Gemmatimonadota bacterium]
MSEQASAADRRKASDRRERGSVESRRGAKKSTSGVVYVIRSLGLVVVLVLVIVYAVVNTRPIYAGRGTLGEELTGRAPASVPHDTTDADLFVLTPKFQEEKRNFYEDVMRLKQVDSARADSIAQFAVREAYVRGISPAIIFGVMLTENAKFISAATSSVGAVGLMQVYPKIWLTKEMTSLFGKDLATDSTNVKYGVFILSKYFSPRTSKKGVTTQPDWKTALLHYNGCVKGTNTPRCHTYPGKVQSFITAQAKSICDGRGFYECIAKPFVEGLFGDVPATKAATK